MEDNIESRGTLWDADDIKVRTEGYIDIDDDKLPASDNKLVFDKLSAPKSIFENDFLHNSFWHIRMW